MSRVYMSVLGTSDYHPCTYFAEDCNDVRNARFVQEATLRMYCRDWTPEDKVLIFTTDDARRRNWVDDGHIDRETKRALERRGLKSCIDDLELAAVVHRVPIPEGKSEKEIWRIFSRIYDSLPEGAEVVFDITHSFRSIPMLAMVILNYAKILKGITISGIYYGAFEAPGSIEEEGKLEKEQRRVPILDLTAFDSLLAWAIAVDRFAASGDAGAVCALAAGAVRPLRAASKGRDDDAETIRKISTKLREFSEAVATCRAPNLGAIVQPLKRNLAKYGSQDIVRPFQPVLDRIRGQLEGFEANDQVVMGLQSAKWCLTHNLIQQGYTILEETMITHCIRSVGEDPWDVELRERASWLAHAQYRAQGSVREPCQQRKPASAEKCRIYLTEHTELVKTLRQLADYRNDLNHAGWRKNPKPPKTFREGLSKLIREAEKSVVS